MQLVRLISAVVLTIYRHHVWDSRRDGLAALQFMFRGYWSSISYPLPGNGSNYGSIAYAGKVLFNQVTAAYCKPTSMASVSPMPRQIRLSPPRPRQA